MTIYYGAEFVSGLIAAGYLVLGLFFLRFWRRTRDQLFASFACAFWLLSLNRAIAALAQIDETASWFYLIRLAAFIVFTIGIVRKNVPPPSRAPVSRAPGSAP
jgi:hypothetical protein